MQIIAKTERCQKFDCLSVVHIADRTSRSIKCRMLKRYLFDKHLHHTLNIAYSSFKRICSDGPFVLTLLHFSDCIRPEIVCWRCAFIKKFGNYSVPRKFVYLHKRKFQASNREYPNKKSKERIVVNRSSTLKNGI